MENSVTETGSHNAPTDRTDSHWRHKNWPEICGVEDYHVRIGVSLVSAEDHPQAFAKYHEDFPHLFSHTPVPLRVPFNALVEYSVPFVSGDSRETALQCLAHVCAPEALGIPCQAYGYYENLPPIPKVLREATRGKHAGDLVEYDGRSFVVIESNLVESPDEDLGFLAIAPAEYIFLDEYNPAGWKKENTHDVLSLPGDLST